MRLLICAGGTGGGVNPALAVLRALENELGPANRPGARETSLSALWVGVEGGMESELVSRAGIPFEAISAAGVHGVGLRRLPGNLVQLGRGYRQAGEILKRFKPDVMLFTGGYVAVPMALAGRRVPSVLYVPDIVPGLALKFLSRFASRIAVTAEQSRSYFSKTKDITVTGYPVRAELTTWDKAEAARRLGLDSTLPTLLVVGGSSGARSLNRALMTALPELLDTMQIIHLTGRLDWEEVENHRNSLSSYGVTPECVRRYHIYAYLHEDMSAALSAADVVLARAGASVLGEFPLYGLPAILAPYPYAWDYQKVNADFLADRGAALVVTDQDLPDRLVGLVHELINDPERRARMGRAMRSLAKPGAARSIAELITGLVGQESRKGERP
ncbi:MAG: UDP-N-acetylglucosamine--N-acetylmuramyl-(pentapeptide) pyrophosphoryl-undecaprenol N-acetylglucosamine transferase [Anaerolineales bacterium]|nr:UDP-N-acetylglucosamine--N-acetylmuramyl-(pentapeptide) pyrophosphoryl-undecaprenol N-acetylglucosamine transferase [Anaerolineales bacterium]